jgi:hypothetical protein
VQGSGMQRNQLVAKRRWADRTTPLRNAVAH